MILEWYTYVGSMQEEVYFILYKKIKVLVQGKEAPIFKILGIELLLIRGCFSGSSKFPILHNMNVTLLN